MRWRYLDIQVFNGTVDDLKQWIADGCPLKLPAPTTGVVTGSVIKFMGQPGINLRSKPTTGSSVICGIPYGTTLSVISTVQDEYSRPWNRVEYNKKIGYLAGWLCNLVQGK